jgi:hypothetical protein
LTVVTNPRDARIRVLNIKQRYHDGILLSPSRYQIAIERSGYSTYTKWVTITDRNVTLQVDLKRLPKAHRKKLVKRPTVYYKHNPSIYRREPAFFRDQQEFIGVTPGFNR